MDNLVPIWIAAFNNGIDRSELQALCDNEQVLDIVWHGGAWWMPAKPVILSKGESIAAANPAHRAAGMLPVAYVAKRDGLSIDVVTRLCRLGLVDGAVKRNGYWYIPEATMVAKPRRGRPIAAPLIEPTNGS